MKSAMIFYLILLLIKASPKMVSSSQLSGIKKDTIFGATITFFGPSYCVMALVVQGKYNEYIGRNKLTVNKINTEKPYFNRNYLSLL